MTIRLNNMRRKVPRSREDLNIIMLKNKIVNRLNYILENIDSRGKLISL